MITLYSSRWSIVLHGTYPTFNSQSHRCFRSAYAYSLITLVSGLGHHHKHDPHLFFETGPMLFTFVSLGRYLEHMAKGKTSNALSKLMSLQASSATLIEHGDNGETSTKSIAIELVQRGDLILVSRWKEGREEHKAVGEMILALGEGNNRFRGEITAVEKARLAAEKEAASRVRGELKRKARRELRIAWLY